MAPHTTAALVGAMRASTESEGGIAASSKSGATDSHKVQAWDVSASQRSTGSRKSAHQMNIWEQTATLADALLPRGHMKQDFLDHLTRAINEEAEEHYETNKAHWFVENIVFKTIVTCLILTNACMMGIEVDTSDWDGWSAVNHTFAAAFFIEMLIKWYVLRCEYFADRWNWMDCVLAIMGFVDTWVMTMLQQDDAGLQQFSILRLLRLVRLLRLARLFKAFTKLVIVMRSIVDAIQTTCWVTFVLTICIYVCAIFCVEVIGHAPSDTYPGYASDMADIDQQEVMMNFNPKIVFGSLASAMLTLFNIAIFAEWTEVIRPIWIKQPSMILFFIAFAMFVCFGVMNVIIGMIVDSVMINARQMEQEEEHFAKVEKLRVLEELKEMIFVIDGNDDHKVDLEEIDQCLRTDTKIHGLMQKAKLPYHLSPLELLSMLDNDGDGTLQYEEFIGAFYRLIHADGFQQTCMLQMGVNELKKSLRDLSSAITDRLGKIDIGLQDLSRRCRGDGFAGKEQSFSRVTELREVDREHVAQVKGDVPCTRPEEVQSRLDKMQQSVAVAVQQALEQEVNELMAMLRRDDCCHYRAADDEARRRPIAAKKDGCVKNVVLPNVAGQNHIASESASECGNTREGENNLFHTSQPSEEERASQKQCDRCHGIHPHQSCEWSQ